MVEFHSLWNLPTAQRIARALEEFEPFWYEDPLKADNLDALADLRRRDPRADHGQRDARHPLVLPRGVRARRRRHRHARHLRWCGGISEAKKIATMAEAYQLPVAPHDCTGPVVLIASTHLSINAPNALIQETVRAYYTGWYTRARHRPPRHRQRHHRPAPRPRPRHRAPPRPRTTAPTPTSGSVHWVNA